MEQMEAAAVVEEEPAAVAFMVNAMAGLLDGMSEMSLLLALFVLVTWPILLAVRNHLTRIENDRFSCPQKCKTWSLAFRCS